MSKKSLTKNKIKSIIIDDSIVKKYDNIQHLIEEVMKNVVQNPNLVPTKEQKKIIIKTDDDIYNRFKQILKEKGWTVSGFLNFFLRDLKF